MSFYLAKEQQAGICLFDLLQIVGVSEIAARCGSHPATVANWAVRAPALIPFPVPIFELKAGKFYFWPEVEEWLRHTAPNRTKYNPRKNIRKE